MKQTLTEKILSAGAGRKVKAGEVVFVNIDWALVQDGTGPLTMDVIEELGKGVTNPDRQCIFLDHASPSSKSELSDNHIKLRKASEKYSMRLFEVGEGVCHQLMAEDCVVPGDVVVGADSHTCMAGAFGAFASGYGSTDIAVAMATGKIWLKVPSAIKIVLEGELTYPTLAKDLILYLIGELGASGATYKALEFTGPGVETLSMESRLTICNMAIEAGAKNGIMPADDKVADYILEHRGVSFDFERLRADDGAEYEREIKINLSELKPQVAAPHSVDNVTTVEELQKEKIKIDQVFIGTCTGGRLEDLRDAEKITRGKTKNPNVRFIITPASKKIFLEAMREGLLDSFMETGAMIGTPGCGPCVGIQGGILGQGEACLSTANRNFKGRMGCGESFIYLASPATAAAAALSGEISSP
ncbi:MAG: 3-isopropylmalate dehydratase large subunit [Elusimicrobia bacterium]|nr:3-isopropylmalate dehydratase large subunit [Elusimicrobiota bacterium]